MLRAHIDHITITAPSLAVGVEYVRQALGVVPQAGGEHPRMGSHNCLLKLGDTVFLEVISINPDAPPPSRPRWFELDQPDLNRYPRLAMWVARTNDIQAAVKASPVFPGDVEPMTRRQLEWLITIPKDGSLPLQGVAPTLIQWHTETHPSCTLQDLGCSLVRLEGFHAEAEKVNSMLQSIGFQGQFSVSAVHSLRSPLLTGDQRECNANAERPYLVAHIQTPTGLRRLGGPGFSPDPYPQQRRAD
jgi:hypothetical protein